MGDFFGGRNEITLEKTDKEQGDRKEPNEQGDQNISYNALSSGGSHLFPQRLSRKGNHARREFFATASPFSEVSLSFSLRAFLNFINRIFSEEWKGERRNGRIMAYWKNGKAKDRKAGMRKSRNGGVLCLAQDIQELSRHLLLGLDRLDVGLEGTLSEIEVDYLFTQIYIG